MFLSDLHTQSLDSNALNITESIKPIAHIGDHAHTYISVKLIISNFD
jgi:hypothetical protein